MRSFPSNIFMILLLSLTVFAAGISGVYFYIEAKAGIAENVEYTRSYSIPLADALARVAELNYSTKDYSKLKALLAGKSVEKNMEEAFFVLADGRIIAHSDSKRAKKLRGKIANDKSAYNIDQIFLPLKSRSKRAQFLDYNIKNKKIPFNGDIIKILKKYFNDKFDVAGWLVTKAVYHRGKAVGCVCLIIGKDKIYNTVKADSSKAIYISLVLFIIGFLFSMLMSFTLKGGYRAAEVPRYTGTREKKIVIKDAIRVAGTHGAGGPKKGADREMTVPARRFDDERPEGAGADASISDAIRRSAR